MTSEFSDLLDLAQAWLLNGTLDGSLQWERCDDPDDPDGDGAVRIVRAPLDLHTVFIRSEDTLRIEANGSVEEHKIDPGLYWSALGSTERWETK